MPDDIETIHENREDVPLTTKRVPYEGEVYEFERRLGGEYEFAGEGTAPIGAVQALQEHLSEDATVAEATEAGKYTTAGSEAGAAGE